MADTGIQSPVMSDIAGLKVSSRPSFRADAQTAHALALYCKGELRTPTQAMTLALRQFLPKKYIEEAQKILRTKKTGKAAK